jgi:hypothetical protein
VERLIALWAWDIEVRDDRLARSAGAPRPLDRSGLAPARADDLHGVPADVRPSRAVPLRGHRRLLVDGRARLGTATIDPATLRGRRTGGSATALADASLVEDFHPGSGQGLAEDPIQVPLMMLDDQDPAAGGRLLGLRVTRCVALARLHWPEPGREGHRAVAVAPWAGLLDGEAVAV